MLFIWGHQDATRSCARLYEPQSLALSRVGGGVAFLQLKTWRKVLMNSTRLDT